MVGRRKVKGRSERERGDSRKKETKSFHLEKEEAKIMKRRKKTDFCEGRCPANRWEKKGKSFAKAPW